MSLLEQSQQWYPTHVRVVVIRARGLRSKGKDGTNDAFVIMQLGKEKYSSSVAQKSREPLWREEAEFELPLLQQQGAKEKSTLYLIVTHRALVGLDKFLGQAVIDLAELYQHKTRNKVGWHKLHSKHGKKEKERGEIEVDIRFVRNNMTASMFDLSMKDKSRSTLGKLKDRFKGKKKDGFSDSMSAVVPSTGASADSHDEDVAPKKSKLKMLFPNPNLQRNTLSQSMSVLPTGPTSPADVSKKARAVDEDFTEIHLQNSPEEESSSKTFHVPKIMTHKRTSSADTKQVNLTPSVAGKKEAPSFFGGLRPKSDPMSQSNLCINGSHVYNEEPNPISPSRPKGDPKLMSNSQFYTSVEDLSSKSTASSAETSSGFSFDVQVLKSTTPSASQSFGSTGDLTTQRSDQPKEKDVGLPQSPKREQLAGKNTDTVNVVGGSTKSLNPFEDDVAEEEKKVRLTPEVEAVPKKEEPKRGGILPLFSRKTEAAKASGAKDSQNPFDMAEAKKPPTSLWANRTAAVKPKLDVSPKAETKASSLSSPLLTEPCSPSFPAVSDPFSLAPAIGLNGSTFSSLHLTYSPAAQPLHSSLNAKLDSMGSSSCADEFHLSPSPLPSACGSSPPTTSLDTQTSQFPSEPVVGRSEEAAVPCMQSRKTLAQCLFQELTGRSVGEDWSNSAVEQCDPSPGSPIKIIPEGRLENTDEVGGGGSEQEMETPRSMASQGEVFVEPLPLINFDPMPVSEASQPLEPPKVSPCSSLSSSDVQLVQREKVPPTPAPRKLMAMNQASDGLLQPSEGQLLEDLISFQWKVEQDEEMAVESAESGETDPTLAVGNSVYDLLTGQGEGDCGGMLVAELEPSTILRGGSSEAITDPLVPTVEEMGVNMGSPSSLGICGQLVFPGKLEVSTEDAFTKEQTEAGSQSLSPEPPTPPAVTLAWELEAQSPFDLKSDQNQIITDSNDLGSLRFVMVETNDSKAHLQELVNESQSDNEVTLSECEGEPFGQSADRSKRTALPDKNDSEELSVKANFGNPELTADVIEPSILDVGRDALHSNEEPFADPELQTSESSAVASSSSFQLVESVDFVSGEVGASPAPLDSVELLVPPLCLSALSQFACPALDDPPLIKPPVGSSHEVECSGQKKVLQARVLPTETQPILSQSSGSTVPSKHRPRPVKPMSAVEARFNERSPEENLKSKIKNVNVLVTKSAGHSLAVNENQTLKDYDPPDPAAAYSQLTHDELIQLVLKQNEVIAKKDGHLRDLESYIDNLLVRVMEETPNILKVA
ncbi:rab11 family-interacting protein 1-like isoform X1 [Mobula birostris]|uniref:rab11 family-interacting protein 1-like isoform X1 n=1 Tax=Mobula birostris TaxID=1983395 RepID=UPI003B28618E